MGAIENWSTIHAPTCHSIYYGIPIGAFWQEHTDKPLGALEAQFSILKYKGTISQQISVEVGERTFAIKYLVDTFHLS